MPKSWFRITNAADESSPAEIYIYDYIGSYGVEAQSFIALLNALEATSIKVRINSPGGEVFAGYAIFNALQRKSQSGVVITTHVDGIAASMASVIAMAGDTVEMAENAMMMIHNPCGGVCGDSEDMRQMAEVLDRVKLSIVNSYAKKTGLDADEISALMDAETYMTAEEAKAKGFCDVVTAKNEAENAIARNFDFSRFAKSPFTASLTPPAETMSATAPAANKGFFTKIVALVAATVAGGNSKPEDLQNEISNAIESTITNLTDERDNALGQVTNLTNELATARTEVTNVTKERDDLKTQLETANGQIEAVKNSVKDQAGQIAVDVLASLGVPPVEKETPAEVTATNSVAAAVAAFNAETDPTKRAQLWENVQAAWKKADAK